MVFRLPRRLKLGCERPFGRGGNLVALAGLSALLTSAAQAQIVIGGHGGPAVSVDNSVLERLGPPLTLPQFFLGGRNPSAVNRQVASNQHATTHSAAPSHRKVKRHVATRSKKHPTSHKTAVAKAAPARTAKAPVKIAAASSSSLNQIIHLIPPKPRVASLAPTPPAETGYQQITHQEVAISAPTKPAVVALAAPAPTPAPAPKQPPSNDIPAPAVVPPQQARVETPFAPVTPPTQSVAAAAPPVAALAPTVIASAAPMAIPSTAPTPTPGPTVSATPAVPPMTVAVAAPTPSAAVTSAPPTVAAPPVQMAAATTIGNAASALKFKAGVTDLSGAQPVLDTIASKLLANKTLRVQLVSHATGGPDDAMEARRVSLARAVAVRAYLIDKGVRSLRIDVRALGNRADNGPAADQVDLLVVSQ